MLNVLFLTSVVTFTLRFFVSLNAKFHPPTIRVRLALDAMWILFLCVCVVGISVALVTDKAQPAQAIATVAIGVYGAILCVCK